MRFCIHARRHKLDFCEHRARTATRFLEMSTDTLTDAMRASVERVPQPFVPLVRRRRLGPAHVPKLASSLDTIPTAVPFIGRYEVTRTDDSAMSNELTAACESQRTADARGVSKEVTGRLSYRLQRGKGGGKGASKGSRG